MAGSVHGGDARARTDDVRRLVRHTRVAVAGLGYPYRLAAAASWSSLPFLTLIRQPVLVMGGGDPIVPVPGILATLLPKRHHPARLPRRSRRTTHRGHRLRAADPLNS